MSENTLLYSATQVEPPTSELDINSEYSHARYSDTLLIAPYRNRGTIEFARLWDYFSALYNNARESGHQSFSSYLPESPLLRI